MTIPFGKMEDCEWNSLTGKITEVDMDMFPGAYICLDCLEEFPSKSSNPAVSNLMRPEIFRTQAIIHAMNTGHENFHLIGTDIKVKIKTNLDD